MLLPIRLLIPSRFRKAPGTSRPQPGPPPLAIDFRSPKSDSEPTREIPTEQLEWLLAQAKVPR